MSSSFSKRKIRVHTVTDRMKPIIHVHGNFLLKKKYFLETFSPCMFFLKLFGGCPAAFQHPHEGLRGKWWRNLTFSNIFCLFLIHLHMIFSIINCAAFLLNDELTADRILGHTLDVVQSSAICFTVAYLMVYQEEILNLMEDILENLIENNGINFKIIKKEMSRYVAFLLSSYVIYTCTVVYRMVIFSDKQIQGLFNYEFNINGLENLSTNLKKILLGCYYMWDTFSQLLVMPNTLVIIVYYMSHIFEQIILNFQNIETPHVTQESFKTLITKIIHARKLKYRMENIAAKPIFLWYFIKTVTLIMKLPILMIRIERQSFVTALGFMNTLSYALLNFCIFSLKLANIQTSYEDFIAKNLQTNIISIQELPFQDFVTLYDLYCKVSSESSAFYFQVANFFVVSRGFILTMLSGIIPFAVILKQFS